MRTLMFLAFISLFLSEEARAGEIGLEPAAKQTQGEDPTVTTLKGFRALRDTSILTIQGGRLARAISLPRGIELLAIETKQDEALGSIVRLGIDQDPALPAEIWVRMQDLENQDFLPYDFSGDSNDEIGPWKGMTYCYRYVKQYLLQTGQVNSYLPGGSAYQAATILPKHGFRNTGRGPASARNGEICVYSGGPRGHGHIEVKRNGKWWYGYGFINHPIQNRRFLACFVK